MLEWQLYMMHVNRSIFEILRDNKFNQLFKSAVSACSRSTRMIHILRAQCNHILSVHTPHSILLQQLYDIRILTVCTEQLLDLAGIFRTVHHSTFLSFFLSCFHSLFFSLLLLSSVFHSIFSFFFRTLWTFILIEINTGSDIVRPSFWVNWKTRNGELMLIKR